MVEEGDDDREEGAVSHLTCRKHFRSISHDEPAFAVELEEHAHFTAVLDTEALLAT